MDQMIAKLSNLGYEFFGIFLPGLLCGLFFIYWFWSLGTLPAHLLGGTDEAVAISSLSRLIDALTINLRVTTALMALASVYFIGHALHWISRTGPESENANSWVRTFYCIFCFKLLKPKGNHFDKLAPLYEELKSFYGLGPSAEWGQFFPVAKAYLTTNLQTSLVSNYQNKYTLHRSIASAASILWWLSVVTIVGVLCSGLYSYPRWIPLILSVPASFVIAWNFSSSYQYNWLMFGNAIITESFMLAKAPKR